jgi:tellurite resistance protein TehA-like permease
MKIITYRADFSFELRFVKVFEITSQICMNFFCLGRSSH